MIRTAYFFVSKPARTAGIYVFVCLMYIYFSDKLLKLLYSDVDKISRLQTVKGACFVVLSGALLFLLVDRFAKGMKEQFEIASLERKRSYNDLKRSEQKYWTVFNFSPLPMWIYDVNSLKFLLVNNAACDKYGYSAEEFYKMRITDIRSSGDLPRLFSALEQAKRVKHKVWDQHFSHICKDGRKLSVRIESTEMQFDDHLGRLVISSDITEKVKADKLLAEANFRLRSACDIANLGYWSYDVRTSEVYWSEDLFKILEYDKDAFSPTWNGMMAMINEVDRGNFYSHETGKSEPREIEHRVTTGKGNEKWMLQRLSSSYDDEGGVLLVEGVVLDITERKYALHALQNSNERFKMVAKATVEAIIDWDLRTGEVYWGDGFAEQFGYDLFSSGNTLWLGNIHPEDKKRVLSRLMTALSDRNTQHFFEDFRFRKANGQFAFVEHRGVFIRDNSGQVTRAIGAMIDVTMLKEKLIEIETQNQQLRKIAWVQSHIVRAPLANLVGLAKILNEHELSDIDSREVIAKMIESANKLDNVVHEIVKLSDDLDGSVGV